MIKKSCLAAAGVGATVALTSCAQLLGFPPPQQWSSQPPSVTVQNETFVATVIPGYTEYGCKAFGLTLMNKTDKNIEVDWNKTLFISGGQTAGTFMFEGIVYMARNNTKPSDIVFAKGSLSKVIWPNKLVTFSSGKYGGWHHQSMSPGENGVYLTVVVDGKELHEKLTSIVTVAPKQ